MDQLTRKPAAESRTALDETMNAYNGPHPSYRQVGTCRAAQHPLSDERAGATRPSCFRSPERVSKNVDHLAS